MLALQNEKNQRDQNEELLLGMVSASLEELGPTQAEMLEFYALRLGIKDKKGLNDYLRALQDNAYNE